MNTITESIKWHYLFFAAVSGVLVLLMHFTVLRPASRRAAIGASRSAERRALVLITDRLSKNATSFMLKAAGKSDMTEKLENLLQAIQAELPAVQGYPHLDQALQAFISDAVLLTVQPDFPEASVDSAQWVRLRSAYGALQSESFNALELLGTNS